MMRLCGEYRGRTDDLPESLRGALAIPIAIGRAYQPINIFSTLFLFYF